MKSTQIAATVILLALLIALPAHSAPILWNKKKKEIAAKEMAEKRRVDSLKNVTPYDKLFAEKKNLISKKSFVTVNKLEDKIYFEITPDAFGKELLLSSVINKVSDPQMVSVGRSGMASQRLLLERTDSLVLLSRPGYNIKIDGTDVNMEKALEAAQAKAIVYAFPIIATTNDGSAVVCEVTPLFSMNNKELVNLRGAPAGDGIVVLSSDAVTGLSLFKNLETYDQSVSALIESAFKLSLALSLGFELADKPEVNLEVRVSLTLLPEEKMHTREADARIGTQFVKYTSFNSEGGAKNGYHASRWKLEATDSLQAGLVSPRRPITVYVDTLFSPEWFTAIRKGIEAWNPLFEEAGFRDVIVVKPYPSDSTFFAGDPLKSCVSLSQSFTNISMRLLTDPRTGEILSVNMQVPRDYAFSVRRSGVYLMAEADERFRNYFLDSGLLCEVLTAQIMRNMGLALGLAPNMAGSAAYSMEQLRSPQFTGQYGITASVTDNVWYNYLALPGDKEKGVTLITSKPGVYDYHAIKWLYKPVAGNEKDTLDTWLKQVSGDKRYYYGKEQRLTLDPRSLSGDLGDDVFTATDIALSHLKYVARESPAWIQNDTIPENYKIFFPEHLFLVLNDVIGRLNYSIGAFYINECREGGEMPSDVSFPREYQKKAVNQLLTIGDDFSWLDANREYVTMGGPNNNYSTFSYQNLSPVKRIFFRIPYVLLAEQKSPDAYSCEELLDDLSAYLFQDVAAGRPVASHRLVYIGHYIQSLIAQSETLKANVIAAKAKKTGYADITNTDERDEWTEDPAARISVFDNAMEATTAIRLFYPREIEPLCYMKLQEARQKLRKGIGYCKDQYLRDMYNYYITQINNALNPV